MDPRTDLCLTPQCFSNVDLAGDLFNNINLQVRVGWGPSAPGFSCSGPEPTMHSMHIQASTDRCNVAPLPPSAVLVLLAARRRRLGLHRLHW